MAPLWFASNANQQMAAVRQQPPGRMHHPVGPPSRMPPNLNGPVPAPAAPYPRMAAPMRGQQLPPGNRMPPRAMHPLPPMGGPLHHMQSGKGRPFVARPPPPMNMRMPQFGADNRGPRRLPPPPNMGMHVNGRMNFHPHMHRPLPPPQHNGVIHRGMHLHQVPRQGGPMPHPMAGPLPPRMPPLQGRLRGAPGPMRVPHPPPPPVSTGQVPLRELRNQNIPPPQEVVSAIFPQKQASVKELKTAPKKAKTTTTTLAQDAAADAAEILLGLRTIPSPPLSTEEKLEDRHETNESPSLSTHEHICLPTRLAVSEDESKLNSMHCFLRSDLLELFVVEGTRSPKNSTAGGHSPSTIDTQQGYKVGSASGRVGLRCVHCAKARLRNLCSDGEAPMAVFYPKSISELYRLVTSWQRVHLRKCRNLPPAVREIYEKTRQDKSRGKTQWWVTSSQQIGLVNCTSKAGGIRFATAPNGLSS